MPNQALSFGLLFGGGILLTKAVTGSSLADIVKGQPGAASSTGQNLAGAGVAGAGASLANAASSAAAAVGGSPAHGDVPANAQAIYKGLTAAGLSANAAAGIVGNIAQESSGNPTAQEAGGTGYGLIQWTPGSASRYGTTVAEQIPEILQYIASNGSVADINSHAGSASEAALYFSQAYERPLASAANNPYRQASAEAVAQAAQSGGW